MQIVLNTCYGEMYLSDEGLALYKKKSGKDWTPNDRTSRFLIDTVKELGVDKAGGAFSKLRIHDVPGVATDYRIIEYDGMERVLYVVDGKIRELKQEL